MIRQNHTDKIKAVGLMYYGPWTAPYIPALKDEVLRRD